MLSIHYITDASNQLVRKRGLWYNSNVPKNEIPSRLSPSKLSTYNQCPKRFYFQVVKGIPSPPSLATIKGNVAHYCLEAIFVTPKGQRHKTLTQSFVAPALNAFLDPNKPFSELDPLSIDYTFRTAIGLYREALEADSSVLSQALRTAETANKFLLEEAEKTDITIEELHQDIISQVEDLVGLWHEMEDPNKFTPVGRELHVEAPIEGALFHGYIDRLDRIENSRGEIITYISDYKTGAVPRQPYVEKAFFAMKLYALLYQESTGIVPDILRLVYVKTGSKKEGILRLKITPEILDNIKQEVISLYRELEKSYQTSSWPTKVGPLCNWCAYKSICPAFTKTTT